jgi:hypothetical protein
MDKKEPLDSHLDCLGAPIREEWSGLGSQAITKSSIRQSDNKICDIFVYIHSKSRIYNKCAVLNQLRVAKSIEIVTVFEGDDEYAC